MPRYLCLYVIWGGVTGPEHVATLRASGFDAIAMGRTLLHNPDLIDQWSDGLREPSGCDACNLCVAEMYTDEGTHCVVTGQPALEERTALR